MLSPNPTWLQWAQRIQSIAQAGLAYSKDPYDQERFRDLRRIAAEIVSSYTALPVETVTTVFGEEAGYPTPKVDIRAAVFNEQGQLLLVREREDGLWSLPGGWADVGDSPSEVAVREVCEESGFHVRPIKVLAVLDRTRHPHPSMLWYTYRVFFRCELVGGEPLDSLETTGAAFFDRSNIPPLSTARVLEAQIRRMFEHYDAPTLPADFD
ncbi:MAG TPA: NUDIX hydrolase [Symbiobacteriaceae bacterium]